MKSTAAKAEYVVPPGVLLPKFDIKLTEAPGLFDGVLEVATNFFLPDELDDIAAAPVCVDA